jgi:peroxiredoxin
MKKLLLFLLLSLLSNFSYSAGKAIDFSLPVHGKEETFNLKDHLGKKIILINFWATWCTSCIEELPLLHALQKKHEGQEVLFIGLSAGDTTKKIDKFLKKYKFQYLILKDEEKKVSKAYGIESLPQTLVIDKNQDIIFQGHRPPEKI